MAEYHEVSYHAQVLRLRPTAMQALARYPLEVARLSILNHGYNSTFRVDTVDGQRFALRLAVTSGKTAADLEAEMAWLDALHRDTDLRLPVPQRTLDGRLYTEVWCDATGATIPAALFAWLPGRDLGKAATPEALHEVGRITAALHEHTERWHLPPGARLQSLRSVLAELPDRLDHPLPEFTAPRRALWAQARAVCQAATDAVWARSTPQVLHADIHLANLKLHRGKVALFDFDDSAIGVPLQDLAISVYYVRGHEGLEEALFDGYASVRPLPAASREEFEGVVAGRQLLLLDDLVATGNAALQAIFARYVRNAEIKLRHFLATGRFEHRLEGVETLW